MRVKVLLGTVRTDNREYKVGEEFEINENEAKALINENVVEEVKEEKKPKAKPKVKPEEKAKSEEKVEAKVEAEAKAKPSMEWTVKEVTDHATAKGIKDLEGKTKREMLALIEAAEEGGEEK